MEGTPSHGNNGSSFPESRARRLMRINASNWRDNLEVVETDPRSARSGRWNWGKVDRESNNNCWILGHQVVS